MRGDESFLARWSRRKRRVATQPNAEKNPPTSAAAIAKSVPPTTGQSGAATPLLPIDSIEAASDVTPFLAPEVPPDLQRAALRRAWTADPVIRDFIGLSENAWDFNASGGVPGFGALDLQEVRRLVAQVLDQPRAAGPTSATAPFAERSATPPEANPTVPMIEQRESIAAAQHKNGERKALEYRPRRHHGGALPQ